MNRGHANLAKVRVSAPLGNQHAVKHGAKATLALQPRAREIMDDLRPAFPDLRPADEAQLAILSLLFARIERGHAWLDKQPELVTGRGGKVWPLLAELAKWEITATRLIEKLAPKETAKQSAADVLATYLAGRESS